MVIGNGMLAKAFYSYIETEGVIIYASGVSNSSENSDESFQREISLLENCIKQNPNSLIVYFSTCSVSDESLKETKYVQHKKNIEKYIKEKAKKFIVFRLPIVIGNTINNFTLFNFLKDRLSSNEEIFIQKNAFRYLVDIDDVSNVLSKLIDCDEFLNSIIDVTFSNTISVLDISNIMKRELQSKSKITIINGGGSYYIKDTRFQKFMSNKEITFSEKYNEEVLKKYAKKTI
jgi:nucleoside-diphosphate-sugar epimerase